MKRLTPAILGSLLVAIAALLAFRTSAEQVRNPKPDTQRRLVAKKVGFIKKRKGFADEYVPILAAAQSVAEEREFKNTIPSHVPLKVKVKNEQSFKKMENKNWLRELEIEVKNTGSKPIYYLYAIIGLPEVIVDGHPVGYRVRYGRKELVSFDTPLEPEDVPIRPGESIVLKVPESRIIGYELRRNEEKRADPKKIEFRMQIINFGDGTGFESTEGLPVTKPAKNRSQNAPRLEGAGGNCRDAPDVRWARLSIRFPKAFYSETPARNLRVNFYPPDNMSASAPLSQATFCGCQSSNACMWGLFRSCRLCVR